MERLIILVSRLYKSVAQTKYFFKVPLIGHFMPLVGVVRRPVESPLHRLLIVKCTACQHEFVFDNRNDHNYSQHR